eukprot:gene15423-biopygen1985
MGLFRRDGRTDGQDLGSDTKVFKYQEHFGTRNCKTPHDDIRAPPFSPQTRVLCPRPLRRREPAAQRALQPRRVLGSAQGGGGVKADGRGHMRHDTMRTPLALLGFYDSEQNPNFPRCTHAQGVEDFRTDTK